MDNLKLGYGGTKTEMERLLKDAQKLSGVEYDIDNLADVYEAIHVIQEEMDITGTTALESAETFSGSLASMKASYRDLMGQMALGNDIKPALRNLLSTVGTFFVGNLLPMLGNIFKSLGEIVVEAFTGIGPEFLQSGMTWVSEIANGVVAGLPTFISSLGSIVSGFLAWVTENLPSFLNAGVDMLINIGNGIVQSIPNLITTAGQLVTSLVTFIMDNLPSILQAGVDLIFGLVDGIVQNLPAIATAAYDVVSSFIMAVAEKAPDYIAAGYAVIYNMATGIIERLPNIVSAAYEIMTNIISSIIEKLPEILEAGKSIIQSLIDGIASLVSNVVAQFTQLGSDILAQVQSINLWEAGKGIMNSLLSGLKDAWSGVTNFVGGIGTWIQENKGPIEYDRKLLIPAGKAIMGGLNTSLVEGFKDTQDFVSSIAGTINKKINDNVIPMFDVDGIPSFDVTSAINDQSLKFRGMDLSNSYQTDLTRTNELLEGILLKNPNLVTDDGAILGHFTNLFDKENGIVVRNNRERRLI